MRWWRGKTADEARAVIHKTVKDRGRIECICGRRCKSDRYRVGRSALYGLLRLRRLRRECDRLYSVREVYGPSRAKSSTNLAFFRHIGLIEWQTNGYRITEYGLRFLEGKATVPKWVEMFSNEVVRVSEERVSVASAWGQEWEGPDGSWWERHYG